MSRIVTFYSYKGGVGRTFALANIGVLLAKRGKRVLLVDWDLEAPGVQRYFQSQLQSSLIRHDGEGLIHLLYNASSDPKADWRPFVSNVTIGNDVTLSLLMSGEGAADYVERVRRYSLTEFFEIHHGGAVLDRWRAEWKEAYDYVLIDSRTGITDAGGVCTIYLPDILVFAFSTNHQSFECGLEVVLGAQDARRHLDVFCAPFAVLPLPGRFDGREEIDDARGWLERFSEALRPLYADWLPKDFEPRQILEITKIPYVAKFSFGEPLPVLTHSVTDADLPGFNLENVARLLASDFRDAAVIIDPTSSESTAAAVSPPGGVVTVMFADIVASTALRDALVAVHGQRAGDRVFRDQVLSVCHGRIRTCVERFHGFEVKTFGDGIMVTFSIPADAILCAVDAQRSLRDRPIVVEGQRLALRFGLHTGAATLLVHDGTYDYDGHAVSVAARVEALVSGGDRIYCSGETAALAKVSNGIRFHSYGDYHLKGLSRRVEIVDVLWHEALQPAPPAGSDRRLPYPWLTEWIGREAEMSALVNALSFSRLVTLHGPGGVGKTRLAVETLLAHGERLAHEVVFVSLERAEDSMEALLGAIRDALGVSEGDAPDLDGLCRLLRGVDRLLVLDGFDAVQHAKKSISALSATAGARLLVTSRQPLEVMGERLVRLDPMETNGELATLESYRLFLSLAQQRDANWRPNDDVSMRVVLAATDGLPYLIELVAAVAPKRQLRRLSDELRSQLGRITARDGTTDRHASVEACLEWTLGRLTDDDRVALSRLTVFDGGFEADAADAVGAVSLSSLDALVDAALLRFDRDSDRYTLLSSIRHFGRERLGDKEASQLGRDHARWFIDRLRHADKSLRSPGRDTQASSHRWIEVELPNIRQAMVWARDNDDELYVNAVGWLTTYLSRTSKFSELLRLNEALLQKLNRESQRKAWVVTQNNLGDAYAALPTGNRELNLKAAIACYDDALRCFPDGEYPIEWARTVANVGRANFLRPAASPVMVRDAIRYFDEALKVQNERNFPVDWARTMNYLGDAFAVLPSRFAHDGVQRAIAAYDSALRVYTASDYPFEWAMTQSNLGSAYARLAETDPESMAEAVAAYEAALQVYTERDFPVSWARTQVDIGAAYARLEGGDRDESLARAVACYEAALRIRTESDFPAAWAETQFKMGEAFAAVAKGQHGVGVQRAIAHFEAAARGFAAVGLSLEAEVARTYAARVRHGDSS